MWFLKRLVVKKTEACCTPGHTLGRGVTAGALHLNADGNTCTEVQLTCTCQPSGRKQSWRGSWTCVSKDVLNHVWSPFLLLDAVPVGAAVLAEPLLQRRLPEDPLQVPVEPAAGQQLPDPMVAGGEARRRDRETSLKGFYSWFIFYFLYMYSFISARLVQ